MAAVFGELFTDPSPDVIAKDAQPLDVGILHRQPRKVDVFQPRLARLTFTKAQSVMLTSTNRVCAIAQRVNDASFICRLENSSIASPCAGPLCRVPLPDYSGQPFSWRKASATPIPAATEMLSERNPGRNGILIRKSARA